MVAPMPASRPPHDRVFLGPAANEREGAAIRPFMEPNPIARERPRARRFEADRIAFRK